MKPLEPSDRRIDQIYNPQPQVSRRWGGWLDRAWHAARACRVTLFRCVGISFAGRGSYGHCRSAPRFRAICARREIKPSADTVNVSLPATTAAFEDVEIFARASGYIEEREVDIGDHVKKGQLLAKIAVPELDDQILEAEATLGQLQAALKQAQANSDLAQVTWDRDKPLVAKGWITQQQGTIDVQTLKAQQATVGVAQANVKAQQDQLEVLSQQQLYQQVVAPFDGIITQRNIDKGSLVQADTTSGTFMFAIMQGDVIRTQVFVPQDEAFGVSPG